MRIQGTNIYLTRGDTAYFTLIVVDQDDQPIEITGGDKVVFTVKTSVYTKNVIFQIPGTPSPGEENKVEFEVKPAHTQELDYGRYFYDIQLTRENGDVFTIVTPSVFFVGDEVTF